MEQSVFEMADLKLLLLTLLVLFSCQLADAADHDCDASGEYAFICGPKNAEDLVRVPDTKWIIASGMAPDAAIYLIDSQRKTWAEIYPLTRHVLNKI